MLSGVSGEHAELWHTHGCYGQNTGITLFHVEDLVRAHSGSQGENVVFQKGWKFSPISKNVER